MKHYRVLLLSVLSLLLFSSLFSQTNTPIKSNHQQQFSQEQAKFLEWALTGKGNKPVSKEKAPLQFSAGVFDPDSTGSAYTEDVYFKNWFSPNAQLTPEIQLNALTEAKKAPDEFMVEPNKNVLATRWTQAGPYGMRVLGSSPTVYFSGRITSIDYHPTTGLHVTCGSGGLFGRPVGFNIYPLTDALPSLIAGAVKVHPSNPDMIFFGSGEYGRRPGTGLYKSTDGGDSWYQLPLSPTPTGIQKILVAPWDSSVIFTASDVGLFRSTDFGESWTRVGPWDCSDVAACSIGSVMLAGRARVGVYRSSDYGVTWNKLSADLPALDVGRISITIAPSIINKAYVQISSNAGNNLLGVYRSDNIYFSSSPSWTTITPNINYMSRQGVIHNALAVHPGNANIVWAGGIKLIRSTNGGSSWNEVGTNVGQVHSDIKTIYYRPTDSLVYVGCDGGLFFTDDEGVTWNSVLNQLLPITQFYNIHVSNVDDRIKYGGSQDNGISGTSAGSPNTWTYQVGGDGVDAAVDSSNTQTIYSTDGVYTAPLTWLRRKTTNSGNDWNQVNNGIGETTPWAAIYINQDVSRSQYLYTNAGNYFYYTTNGGGVWTRMNAGALPGNTKHVSSNSTGTFVYGCTDNTAASLIGFQWVGGQTPWTQLQLSTTLPKREVKRVVPSMTNSSRAYALLTGVGDNLKIYKSTNNGTNWTNITGDLPDVAVNDVIENPNNANVLYLGTPTGMFKSINGGTNWYQWNSGMPSAMWVLDLEYAFSASGDYIVAGTFGRSTFERKATGFNSIISLSDAIINFGNTVVGQTKTDSFFVRNLGDTILTITGVRSTTVDVSISPSADIRIAPGDSAWFYLTFTPIEGRGNEGRFDGQIDFLHDGDGSPTSMSVTAFIGDDYKFRTFVPESLMVKNEIRRKTATTSWRFDFVNTAQNQDPAIKLYVEFRQPVLSFDSISPFREYKKVDRSGKKWEFSSGYVGYGKNIGICGQSKMKNQEIKTWWWVIYNETSDTMRDAHGKMLPTRISTGLEMPNTANLRKELFKQAPFNRLAPMIIGNKEVNAKTLKVAYVSFATESDMIGSLTPGRSLKAHNDFPRAFDYYNNGKEMIGAIKKLTPDNQQNSLFAQLIALRVNIYGSATGKMPVGFGELLYNDVNSRYNGMMIKEIDSIANYYMTYADSSTIGTASELDSVITLINEAFVGPIDTISFHSGKLILTGVKSVAEVPFLTRDASITPFTINTDLTSNGQPEVFALDQNYPNPFNPTTSINFTLPEYSTVSMSVFNVLGQVVSTPIVQQSYDAGTHSITFDASNLPSGIYFYRLTGNTIGNDDEGVTSSTFSNTKKMMLIR